MRRLTLALILATLGIPAGAAAQPPATTQPAAGSPVTADYTIFLKSVPIGREQVTLTRSADGITISGDGSIGAPLDIVTRSFEMRYGPGWEPMQLDARGTVRGVLVTLHSTFEHGVASNVMTEAGKEATRADRISERAIILPNQFFGAYVALAAQLPGQQPGGQLRAYLVPNNEITITVASVAAEKIRTPGVAIDARHYVLTAVNATSRATSIDVWTDPNGALLHLAVPAQSLDIVRGDVSTVAARREVISRPGDEQVMIGAAGFSLAATVSKPPAPPAKGVRLPAVVLVAGQDTSDRDELIAGIPIFGQLAAAVADAGFIVVRYDRRGVGQSGGRTEVATLADYADDVKAVVNYLRGRKDVDKNRVALVGYDVGGWIALQAAADNKDVRALALLATPGVAGAELTLEQQRLLLAGMTLPDAEKQKRVELQKKINAAVTSGKGWDGIPQAMRQQADTPWFQSFLAFDPSKTIAKSRQPLLIEHGELDKQVGPSHAGRLDAMAKKRKQPAGNAVQVAKVPGVNHLLARAQTGETAEYPSLPEKQVSADAVGPLVAWLEKTMPAKK